MGIKLGRMGRKQTFHHVSIFMCADVMQQMN